MKLSSANLRTSLPEPGDLAILAGFPLRRPDLLIQRGTVAAVALVDEFQGEEASKGVRIIVSLVSNPANSGGPVFDADGNVLGLLQGNFPSPVKDEAGRYAVYPPDTGSKIAYPCHLQSSDDKPLLFWQSSEAF